LLFVATRSNSCKAGITEKELVQSFEACLIYSNTGIKSAADEKEQIIQKNKNNHMINNMNDNNNKINKSNRFPC
jgi:hypothetical protein